MAAQDEGRRIPMKEEIRASRLRVAPDGHARGAAPVRLQEREREWPYAYLEIAERTAGSTASSPPRPGSCSR